MSHSSAAVLAVVGELLSVSPLAVLFPPRTGLFCGQQEVTVKLLSAHSLALSRNTTLCPVVHTMLL